MLSKTCRNRLVVQIKAAVVGAHSQWQVFRLLSTANTLQHMALAQQQAEQHQKMAAEQLEAARGQAREQEAIAKKQLEAAHQQAIESQIQVNLASKAQEMGKSVLVFTIVTTVFLPLSFFTSVCPSCWLHPCPEDLSNR
jgi:Mg2+ and Co2+ transporter CorA